MAAMDLQVSRVAVVAARQRLAALASHRSVALAAQELPQLLQARHLPALTLLVHTPTEAAGALALPRRWGPVAAEAVALVS
jgi:hypothetical protein